MPSRARPSGCLSSICTSPLQRMRPAVAGTRRRHHRYQSSIRSRCSSIVSPLLFAWLRWQLSGAHAQVATSRDLEQGRISKHPCSRHAEGRSNRSTCVVHADHRPSKACLDRPVVASRACSHDERPNAPLHARRLTYARESTTCSRTHLLRQRQPQDSRDRSAGQQMRLVSFTRTLAWCRAPP